MSDRLPTWVVNATHPVPVLIVDKDTLGRVISEGWQVVSGPDASLATVATGQGVTPRHVLAPVAISDTPFDDNLIGLPPEPEPEHIAEHEVTEAVKATATRNAHAKAWVAKKA
jgi:hypothetical protein